MESTPTSMSRSADRRGRYAPSPTGPLHMGNLRTALLAWLFARHAGAEFVLRVEDIDRQRTKPGCAEGMIDDLRWLGLDWDEGPDVGGQFAPYRQSDRIPLYRQHLERLIAADQVYPCFCSRRDVTEAASAPHTLRSTGEYPGTCRTPDGRLRQRLRNPTRQPAYRVKIEDQDLLFVDHVLGPMTMHIRAPFDDFVVWRSDSTPAYQLAVVVDDSLMRIGEVVRGADLVDSTPLQLLLVQMLGYRQPQYAHVPVWCDSNGSRLSKRSGSDGIATFRANGATPERVVGMLAASCGLVPAGTFCSPREVLAGFSPDRLGVSLRGY
jgi:glutamyl-tRNA synthetase